MFVSIDSTYRLLLSELNLSLGAPGRPVSIGVCILLVVSFPFLTRFLYSPSKCHSLPVELDKLVFLATL